MHTDRSSDLIDRKLLFRHLVSFSIQELYCCCLEFLRFCCIIAKADCKAMVERAEQEVQQRWQAFDRKANELLDQYRSTDGLPSEET